MKKSTVRTLIGMVVACLAITFGYMLLNPTTDRPATAEEIAESRNYVIDWTRIPGWEAGMTEKEFLLNLCSFSGEQTIGDTVHTRYTSDVLPEYLYRCGEITEIVERQGYLYISYLAEDGDQIILAYSDDGIYEVCVYDAESDTLFHEIDGNAVVWNKFRKGFQWGK